MTREPGLPLTTGEGNTVERRVREMLVALRLELPSAVWDDVYERTNALSVECGRLREQLAATREGLKRAENDAVFFFNLADGVELKPEVRRAVAGGTLRAVRAALGVEGPAG